MSKIGLVNVGTLLRIAGIETAMTDFLAAFSDLSQNAKVTGLLKSVHVCQS